MSFGLIHYFNLIYGDHLHFEKRNVLDYQLFGSSSIFDLRITLLYCFLNAIAHSRLHHETGLKISFKLQGKGKEEALKRMTNCGIHVC